MFVKSLFHYAVWVQITILLFVCNEIGSPVRDIYRHNQSVSTKFFRGFQQNTWGIF